MCPVSYTSILLSSPFFGMPPQSYWWPCCFRRFISKCWFNSEPSMDGQVYPRPRNFFPDNSRPLSGIQLCFPLVSVGWMFRALVRRRPTPVRAKEGFSHFVLFYFSDKTRVIFLFHFPVKRSWQNVKNNSNSNKTIKNWEREGERIRREVCVWQRRANHTRVLRCRYLFFVFPHVSSIPPDASRLHPDGEIWSRPPLKAIRLFFFFYFFFLFSDFPYECDELRQRPKLPTPGASTAKRDTFCLLIVNRKNLGHVKRCCCYFFSLLLLCPFSFQQIRPLLHTHTHKDTLKRRIKKWSCASPSKWRIKTDRPADTRNPFIHLLSVSCLFIFWHFQFSHGVRFLGKIIGDNNKKTRRFIIIFIIFLINQTNRRNKKGGRHICTRQAVTHEFAWLCIERNVGRKKEKFEFQKKKKRKEKTLIPIGASHVHNSTSTTTTTTTTQSYIP